MTITDLVAPEAILPALKVNSKKQARSEEHTSELQSQFHLVCRLLLEKKKKKKKQTIQLKNKKSKQRRKRVAESSTQHQDTNKHNPHTCQTYKIRHLCSHIIREQNQNT